jgi:prevent-host-death family protein
MKQVRIADLKNNLSRHLAQVRRGGEITVYDRDTPVARIVPYVVPDGASAGRSGAAAAASAERVAGLVRQGVLIKKLRVHITSRFACPLITLIAIAVHHHLCCEKILKSRPYL